jgi:hypothetical protein
MQGLLLVRRGRIRSSAGRSVHGPARDVPCREDREPARVHHSGYALPATLRLPAKVYPERNEYGYRHTIILLFGKNEKAKKVFWSVFIVLAGFVLAQIVDPGTAQAVLRVLTGTG